MKIKDPNDFKPNTLYTDGETVIRTTKDPEKLTFLTTFDMMHVMGTVILTSTKMYKVGGRHGFVIKPEAPFNRIKWPNGRWEEL